MMRQVYKATGIHSLFNQVSDNIRQTERIEIIQKSPFRLGDKSCLF